MLVIASVAQPLVWLVMFSQTFSRLADTPLLRSLGYRSYLAFLVPGMMVLAVLFTALQSGLAMMSDIDGGMLDKFRVSPISRLSILLGRVLADSVTMLAQGIVVLGVGALMGARVETGWLGTFGMLACVTLLGVVWASPADGRRMLRRGPPGPRDARPDRGYSNCRPTWPARPRRCRRAPRARPGASAGIALCSTSTTGSGPGAGRSTASNAAHRTRPPGRRPSRS
jgi:hypothetical protein